jgi:triacylglycerol lipase
MAKIELFEDRKAIFLAAICSQTYKQFSHPDGSFIIPEGYEVAAIFYAKSITGKSERFGLILQSEDHIIIAFRGSSQKTDWISDAIARQSKSKCVVDSGLTHTGISELYYSIREQILSVLGRLSTGKELMITGHSLGGALATLCGLDVSVNSPFHHPILYTYASPRVGDLVFAKKYASLLDRSFRVYNPFDLVPHLPPPIYKLPNREKTFYYMHVQSGIKLPFSKGSVSANHVISSYFTELSKRNPAYVEQLSKRNPGLVPERLEAIRMLEHSAPRI